VKRLLQVPSIAWGALTALCVALVVLYPAWLSPTEVLVGHESLDVWSHAWGQHWFVTQLSSFDLPWHTTGASWPEDRVLWYIDPIGALLSAPLQLFGAAVAWNGLVFLEVFALSLAGWLWGRSLGGRGYLAAMALGSLPMLQGELHNGVSEAVWIAPVALGAWLAAKGSRWCGVAVGVAAVMTPYHGIPAALLAGTLMLMGGAKGERAWKTRAVDCALAAGLTLALALPHILLISESVSSPLTFVNRALWTGFNEPVLLSNAVDPIALVHPGDFWSVPSLDNVLGSPWRRTPYLGLGLLILAPIGIARSPRLAWLLLPFSVIVVATCGLFLWHDGGWVTDANGWRYQLPLGMLVEATGLGLDHPMRFAASASVLLAGLADRGVGKLSLPLGVVLLIEHLALAPNSWPVTTCPAELPAVYEHIPDNDLAVIDLPADSGVAMRTDRYLYWEALHGHPVPWNNKVGTMGTASMNPTLRTWVLLSKTDRPQPGTPGVPDANADLEAALDQLVDAGLGYVIVHPELLAKDHLLQTHRKKISELLGPPEEVEGALVWRVRRN